MTEVKTEVKTFRVKLKCDCGGDMIYNGMVLTSNPPLYPHICDKCEARVNRRNKYPMITTEDIE